MSFKILFFIPPTTSKQDSMQGIFVFKKLQANAPSLLSISKIFFGLYWFVMIFDNLLKCLLIVED